jgi:hypothetical protein
VFFSSLLDKLVRFASRELEVYELHNEGKRIPLVGNLVDIDDQSDIHARLGTVFSDVTQFRSLIIS